MSSPEAVHVYLGEALAAYGFGDGHPFGTDRMSAFRRAFDERGLRERVAVTQPRSGSTDDLALFHERKYLKRLEALSESGSGFLDYGDTPAFKGVLEACLTVAGTVLDGAERLMAGTSRGVFVPIAGLHHARRGRAAGFCAINDCGIAIEALKARFGLERIAYVDIDAHHGDGVFYAFESDPAVINVDFHEDGRYLYPGTGSAEETGTGAATGHKLNIPLPPGAGDEVFARHWPAAEALLERHRPQFIILQCGADSIEGDPITHLALTPAVHGGVAAALVRLAQRHGHSRVLALGGGGYNRDNLGRAWSRVVAALESPDAASFPGPPPG